MTKEKAAKLRFVYGICLSLFSVFVGVLFIVQTWSIYRSAPQSPYTVENITAHFKQIAIPVWLWVAALFGNILLAIAFPEEEKRSKAHTDIKVALDKAKKQVETLKKEGDAISTIQEKEEEFRKIVSCVCFWIVLEIAVIALLILFGVCYKPLIETEFFSRHDGVADKLVQCVLLSVLALSVVCVAAMLNRDSRVRERKCYQEEMVKALKAKKEGKSVEDKKLASVKMEKKTGMKGVWVTRGVLLTVAVAFIVLGIFNGGMQDVLLKAINICTQCIGLG